jgi:hypothetical protein
MNAEHLQWWNSLRHGGMLLDAQRLSDLVPSLPEPLAEYQQDRLRRELTAFRNAPDEKRSEFVKFVLEKTCGVLPGSGDWYRGSKVETKWTRRGLTGEAIRPSHLWLSRNSAVLPVFIDDQKRLGVGRGKRICSQALQWLRQSNCPLAIVTNGFQWRLAFAGLDYDAFCEWEIDQWLAEGTTTTEFAGFRALLRPDMWIPPQPKAACPLAASVNESRKGQADLSQVLGERVRQAAELLIQAHTTALDQQYANLEPKDIYHAAVRMIMRLVVVLFAESREGLLPRDNPVYYSAYSLHGLREILQGTSTYKLDAGFAAWPRILSLLQLISRGSSHEAMPVPAYGGEIFAGGNTHSDDGVQRALHLFETACFEADLMNDRQVWQILDLLTRTQVRIRQGRASTRVTAPVDFSSLDSEYIGILYEGLLDFDLRCAATEVPVIFLAIGNQPALPLTALEEMSDKALKDLLEKVKEEAKKKKPDAGDVDDSAADDGSDDEPDEGEEEPTEEDESEDEAAEEQPDDAQPDDSRFTLQTRALAWAKRACQVGGLVKKPRGRMTPEARMQYERAIDSKARQLIAKVVLPGEWYLVRWGGTRKGSGTFYTRPQLAIPTAHRTLRPLAYAPPQGADGQPNLDAPSEEWTPKKPEEILGLKVCDPACGSGSFCLAALRFLTNALYESLIRHDRVRDHAGRSVLDLIRDKNNQPQLCDESLRCRPDDDEFEPQTKALLRRYVVERCIYGVDLDPLAVELCRLSLWIETLDRNLPLTFLKHKIRPGNSLVGTWLDQFLHYPAMAWDRDGGDFNHENGVHHDKDTWTRAIRSRKGDVKTELIDYIDGQRLLYLMDLSEVRTGHDHAEAALKEIHEMGIVQAPERAAKYDALRRDPSFRRLKDAMDLWCALWFWPADQLDQAPLPHDYAEGRIPEGTWEIVHQLDRQHLFFHWELEFPDVFNASCGGFHAILGNPPWDTLQPVSKEFFSAHDPLYRSYGKQEAVLKQRDCFKQDEVIERKWLNYCAQFKAMGNWLKYAGFAFGDRVTESTEKRTGRTKYAHDFNLGGGGRASFDVSRRRHQKWRQKREETSGYSANAEHAFRYQGEGKAHTYKMFLELSYALLADDGRLGLIVPSGLYSDHGTGGLRRLFVDECRWEWLFGFENRQGIFDIHRSFKFNPVIVRKGGQTQAIRTAFMRRDLADWERAEQFITLYTREQVVQFSPKSRAILEIQSQRDLAVLTKIYSNSVLLGDQSEKGWGIRYAQGDFNMTSDSALFPPRPKWEEWGYQPDEYSRWIKGPWKPIEHLYAEMGVKPLPEGERPCAQPPYDRLPIPRADIPAGIILSRGATHYIREDEIPTVTFTDASGKPLKIKVENEDGEKEDVEVNGAAIALPLYQGGMVQVLSHNYARCEISTRSQTKWIAVDVDALELGPQFLVGRSTCNLASPSSERTRYAFRDIARTTDTKTMIGSLVPPYPCGNTVPVLQTNRPLPGLATVAVSLPVEWTIRARMGGTHLNYYVLAESPLCIPHLPWLRHLELTSIGLSMASTLFATAWSRASSYFGKPWRSWWACTLHERTRLRCQAEAIIAQQLCLAWSDLTHIMRQCDYPVESVAGKNHPVELAPKGFWRIDKDRSPEHRLSVLTLVAFCELQKSIENCSGDTSAGIEAFCNQSNGEGWMLPETLRLADYGLGHSDRSRQHQPVRDCFGPRFYDWQLAQTPEESWKECHLHARNLLGEDGYRRLLAELEGRTEEADKPKAAPKAPQGMLFETADLPLFDRSREEGP